MENYELLETGVMKQKNVDKITYDYNYSNDYNKHGERGNYLSYLRYGVLVGVLQRIPDSIVDIGYGNGSFLNVCKDTIGRVYGCDISEFPVPQGCQKIEISDISNVDVVCFFDSLEHFEDISIIKNLDTKYVFISVPWCHNFSTDWFLKWYHRKPNEHLYHFNKDALLKTFDMNGYNCIHSSNFEDIIRKNAESKYYPNILSCVFKKRNALDMEIANYYKNKRVLVTGGTGFIGRNIVYKLLEYDVAKIIVFDRTLKYVWDDARIKYIKGNLLTDLNQIEHLDFDILFHEAANVDTTCTDETNMIETNYTSFVKLINICSKKGAKMVYASSAAVYGNSPVPNTVGINEAPINIYGKSKLMMDNYVRSSQVSVVGLRYFNVYGPGEELKRNMMSMIGQMIPKIKSGIDVELFEFGEQTRDFIYVKDVAMCNIYIGASVKTGIYNCGYGESVSFNHIFNIIKSYYKSDSKIVYIPQKYDFYQNTTKSQMSRLGWKPVFDIVKGIYDYHKTI